MSIEFHSFGRFTLK